jgi:hypothetical protein
MKLIFFKINYFIFTLKSQLYLHHNIRVLTLIGLSNILLICHLMSIPL